MAACPPDRVKRFFEESGCALKTERGNRVFPVSDRSASILEALQKELRRSGVTVKTGRVTDILTENGHITGVLAGQ
jgi:predicted flavoprotein YhiN